MHTRRNFIQTSVLGLSGLMLSSKAVAMEARGPIAHEDSLRKIKLGVAGYSFVNFDLPTSLAMLKRMQINYLCIKDFHLPYASTDQQIADFHKQLAAANVTGYAVGPIYMKTKEQIDNAFEYAKRVGVNLIIGIPEVADLPYVSEKAKAYDIRYAIHNHGPEDKLYPNASSIISHIKNLDPRVGLCFDMGHNMRDNQDPIKDLVRYKSRIFDVHLKNVTAATKEGTTCELGRGVISIPNFVKALQKIKYAGVCSLEFEKDMKDPLAGIAESAGYFRGVLDTLG